MKLSSLLGFPRKIMRSMGWRAGRNRHFPFWWDSQTLRLGKPPSLTSPFSLQHPLQVAGPPLPGCHQGQETHSFSEAVMFFLKILWPLKINIPILSPSCLPVASASLSWESQRTSQTLEWSRIKEHETEGQKNMVFLSVLYICISSPALKISPSVLYF